MVAFYFTDSCVTFSSSAFLSLNSRMSWKLCMYLHVETKPAFIHTQAGTDQIRKRKETDAHQLWTKRTDGVLSKLSGNRLISFMMLANLTGSSCLRKAKEVFSHAFSEPEEQKFEWQKWFCHLLKIITSDVVNPFCNYVVRLKQNIDSLVTASLSYLHSAGAFSVQSNRDQSSC